MKYILKLLAKISLWFIVIIGILWFCYAWLFFSNFESYTWSAFKGITTELLHIPNMHLEGHISEAIKEGEYDLEHISHDEWMSIECECPDSKSGEYNIPSATKEVKRKLGTKGQKHLTCLSPRALPAIGSKHEILQHCTNFLNCNSTFIIMYDYVLKYPKVLNNIIKIAEKPCFYIKELPDKKENFPLWHAIDQLRGELHCDNNKRPYVVIYFLTKEGEYSSQLIIPRIDTADK